VARRGTAAAGKEAAVTTKIISPSLWPDDGPVDSVLDLYVRHNYPVEGDLPRRFRKTGDRDRVREVLRDAAQVKSIKEV